MHTKLRTKAKSDFEKYFVKLMNNSVFEKTMENVRKHREIRQVATNRRRSQLVSEANYHTTKWFSDNLITIEMKKEKKIKMHEPIYLGTSVLDISKTVIYEYYYDYIKLKYQIRAKLCYMDKDHILHEKFYISQENRRCL